jgi:ABC-type glycerol-3-phosphate transport system substrate-binding protein
LAHKPQRKLIFIYDKDVRNLKINLSKKSYKTKIEAHLMKVNITKFLPIIFVGIVVLVFFLELNNPPKKNEKLEIEFWQYWSGQERKPLEELVAKFNSENHGFTVKMLSISMPRKKILMAVSGKVSPDLVHLDGDMVTDFALRNALVELDRPQGDFMEIFLEMLNINGKQWALPLMPTCEAMHINKNLLAKHNLSAPSSLDDIVRIFDRMNSAQEIGWLPSWPPWAGQFIPIVFGGRWAKDGVPTANSPENIKAWTWVQENFARKIPKDRLAAFTEGLKSYQSPDNPFYTGRIALENNGVWERNLAKIFAPKIAVEVVEFPGLVPKATYVTVDALAIPHYAKHPKEAYEFMLWLLKQENLEYLALAQQKFTPLKSHSPEFFARHPNPYIKIFIDLAQSPNASYFPQLKNVQEYKREIRNSYQKMLRLEASAQEVLDELQLKIRDNS